MKKQFPTTLALGVLAILPLAAIADTLEGKINGLSCAIAGVVCPIDKLDPLVAIEKEFVLQQPDGSFYVIPNVDRAVKARLVLDDVIITGTVNERYKSIEAETIQVKRGGTLTAVWSEAIVEALRKELFGEGKN